MSNVNVPSQEDLEKERKEWEEQIKKEIIEILEDYIQKPAPQSFVNDPNVWKQIFEGFDEGLSKNEVLSYTLPLIEDDGTEKYYSWLQMKVIKEATGLVKRKMINPIALSMISDCDFPPNIMNEILNAFKEGLTEDQAFFMLKKFKTKDIKDQTQTTLMRFAFKEGLSEPQVEFLLKLDTLEESSKILLAMELMKRNYKIKEVEKIISGLTDEQALKIVNSLTTIEAHIGLDSEILSVITDPVLTPQAISSIVSALTEQNINREQLLQIGEELNTSGRNRIEEIIEKIEKKDFTFLNNNMSIDM